MVDWLARGEEDPETSFRQRLLSVATKLQDSGLATAVREVSLESILDTIHAASSREGADPRQIVSEFFSKYRHGTAIRETLDKHKGRAAYASALLGIMAAGYWVGNSNAVKSAAEVAANYKGRALRAFMKIIDNTAAYTGEAKSVISVARALNQDLILRVIRKGEKAKMLEIVLNGVGQTAYWTEATDATAATATVADLYIPHQPGLLEQSMQDLSGIAMNTMDPAEVMTAAEEYLAAAPIHA